MKRRKFLLTSGASLAALALNGCSTLDSEETRGNEILGPALENFSAYGRLSLHQGARSDHLRFDWQHRPEQDNVLLLAPLGQGLAEIVRDPSGARMTRPNEKTITAPTIAALAQTIFGIALPLEELGHWLRGARGIAGNSDGWQVSVTETSPYRQRRLPRRLEVKRDEIGLTLIVDEWLDGD